MNKLEELRTRYRKAISDEEKASIMAEAKILKGEAGYQCYFINKETNKQCPNRQEDYWCSSEHRIAWQEENYVDKRPKGEHKLSIQEMQRRLKEMAKTAKEKKFEEQQKLL